MNRSRSRSKSWSRSRSRSRSRSKNQSKSKSKSRSKIPSYVLLDCVQFGLPCVTIATSCYGKVNMTRSVRT